jgi:hypothetical protein
METIQKLDWSHLIASPLFWISVLAVLSLLVIKRMFKPILAAASVVTFMVLAKSTLPSAGADMPLHDRLVFFGGCVALVAINFYFLLMR